ncbi:MAG TPA: alpha-amylase family glycosyl hydrolase [bacterium]|nr:alpha-amylase family glycosyl hydrolase [bacterium]HPR88898.1 alpha-amylase family glycosyl hydrolase [bacterium]
MRRAARFLAGVGILGVFLTAHAEIILHKKDATVWGEEQHISGGLQGFTATSAALHWNGRTAILAVADSLFTVDLHLDPGTTCLVISADSAGTAVYSDTLRLTLGYLLRPELVAWATADGAGIRLLGRAKANPGDEPLSWRWEADAANPAAVTFTSPADSTTAVVFSDLTRRGEYYFNLYATTSAGESTRVRTLVTLDETGLHPFTIATDHAAWIDAAVLYEITPCDFAAGGKLQDITDRIPELAALGVTALWLQPIFGTRDIGGMGYGITDYFAVRPDVGTKADLHHLVAAAHQHGLRVLLDMVPNHSDIMHPYARDAVRYGTDSHYYTFYQRNAAADPVVPYSQYYNLHPEGFVYYFWDQLPNLNFDHPEVRRWMTEICSYWVREFDVDGYRFDAVWGVNARRPDYTRELRLALKTIKPELLLLAEDKATTANVFVERFDAAFDWGADEGWVSQPAWQVLYHDYWEEQYITIFNSWQQGRSFRLHNALTNSGAGFHPGAKILRFLENNDTQRFARFHTLEVTRMAATLEFTLPGLPLLYNGQEIGYAGPHPYYGEPIFRRGEPIAAQDSKGLYAFYQQLIALRHALPALTSDNFSELTITPGAYLYGFRRWLGDQNLFVLLNMGDRSQNATVNLPIPSLHLDSTRAWYLTEMAGGGVISGKPADLQNLQVTLDKFTARVYLLADTVTVTGIHPPEPESLPLSLSLAQNYPNPFNGATRLHFDLDRSGSVRLQIFNLLGEQVARLIDGYREAGAHAVTFEASGLASGIYWCRLESAGRVAVRKMVIAR